MDKESNRAGILLKLGGSSYLQVQCFSENGFSNLAQDVNDWLEDFSFRILGLALAYGNSKWKVLIVFDRSVLGPGKCEYHVTYEKGTDAQSVQDDITFDLKAANDVAAFGFTYGHGKPSLPKGVCHAHSYENK